MAGCMSDGSLRGIPTGNPDRLAAVWLSCSTRSVRASRSAMASGAISMIRCGLRFLAARSLAAPFDVEQRG